jgi:hypothetical protein
MRCRAGDCLIFVKGTSFPRREGLSNSTRSIPRQALEVHKSDALCKLGSQRCCRRQPSDIWRTPTKERESGY